MPAWVRDPSQTPPRSTYDVGGVSRHGPAFRCARKTDKVLYVPSDQLKTSPWPGLSQLAAFFCGNSDGDDVGH